MNLIGQNCLTGNIYKNCIKEPFGNPFIWTVIDFKSLVYLIENWNNINFHNYELIKDNNWNFSIIIDKHIKVQYVHYKFNKNFNIPKKIGPGDICYNKIWEFIIQKYEERLKRMELKNEPPIFCICNFNTTYKDAIYTEEQLKILEKYKNVFILRGCDKKEPGESAILFTKKYLN